MQRICRFAIGLCVIALAGCHYALPPGFVKVDPGWDAKLKAVSADGAAIKLRTEDNPENGDLVFWEKAIKSRLVDYRGYKLAESRNITHADGTPGVEMLFNYQRDGAEYTYLLQVLVKGRSVQCVEVAGTTEQLSPQLDTIRQAINQWPL